MLLFGQLSFVITDIANRAETLLKNSVWSQGTDIQEGFKQRECSPESWLIRLACNLPV
jgi:hypothetical protein